MVNSIERVKLLAIREGVYAVHVFQNLDTNDYVICTRLPNWQIPNVAIGDAGFLEYQQIKAGEQYYHPGLQHMVVYQYSGVYFINFVQHTDILKNNEIIL